MKRILILTLFLFLLFPSNVFASIGVGVGVGKIQVDQKLKPGTIYELPILTVINTGDEPSEYEVAITYHEKQPELMPPESWFEFTPKKFNLNPGEVQEVKIKLNLPVKTEPGKYFAYVEGHPAKKAENGQTRIGVAAAAKLYFTVVPGSFFEGIYYKALSFWKIYSPWPQRVSILIGILIVLKLFKKFFNIEINLKKKNKDNIEKKDE